MLGKILSLLRDSKECMDRGLLQRLTICELGIADLDHLGHHLELLADPDRYCHLAESNQGAVRYLVSEPLQKQRRHSLDDIELVFDVDSLAYLQTGHGEFDREILVLRNLSAQSQTFDALDQNCGNLITFTALDHLVDLFHGLDHRFHCLVIRLDQL